MQQQDTVCPHGKGCWCLRACGPETDFGAVCVVLTITAVPDSMLSGVYIWQLQFIHFLTLVCAPAFTVIEPGCVPG